MHTRTFIQAASLACLALLASACHESEPSSLLIHAAMEAGAAQDGAAPRPQGAGLVAEQIDLYFGQRYSGEQRSLAAQPQGDAAPDAPTF